MCLPLFSCVIMISGVVFWLQAYKKKTENAKKEYLKQLAAYRASMVSQVKKVPMTVLISSNGKRPWFVSFELRSIP